MSHPGLPPAILSQLQAVFAGFPAVETVKLFGSRAKGTHNLRSDVDLAVIGEQLDRFALAQMQQCIDETDIPCLVDLQDYASLNNQQLIDHIDRVGIDIYRRTSVESLATAPVVPSSIPRQTG